MQNRELTSINAYDGFHFVEGRTASWTKRKSPNTYICSKHFITLEGPTLEYPDPSDAMTGELKQSRRQIQYQATGSISSGCSKLDPWKYYMLNTYTCIFVKSLYKKGQRRLVVQWIRHSPCSPRSFNNVGLCLVWANMWEGVFHMLLIFTGWLGVSITILCDRVVYSMYLPYCVSVY